MGDITVTPRTRLNAISRLGDWLAQERVLVGPPWPLSLLLVAALLVGPVPFAAVIAQQVNLLFWFILIGDLVLLFAFALMTTRQPVFFIGIIALWFALQRIVVALIAPHVSADLVRLLLTYKEGFYLVLLAAAALSCGLRYFKGEQSLPSILLADVIAVAFLGLLAIQFISSPESSSAELTYLRRFAAPVLLYLAGRLLVPRLVQFNDSVRLLIAIALAVAAFGIIERFVLDIAFWRDGVDAATFYSKQVESGLLPENWTVIYRGVPDGLFIGLPLEVPVRRLVSTYLEPTTLGSFLALAMSLLLLAPNLAGGVSRASRIAVSVSVLTLAVAVVATLSRGAMLTATAAVGLFCLVYVTRSRGNLRGLPQPLLMLTLMLIMGAGIILTTLANPPGAEQARDVLSTRLVSGLTAEPPPDTVSPPPVDPSAPLQEIVNHPPGSTADAATKHVNGLRSGLAHMLDHPLGSGLGSAGDWSDDREVGRESTVGALAAQSGVAGFLLYIAFFTSVIASLLVAAWRDDSTNSNIALALAGAMLGLFIVSWVSESASGLLGNAFYLLFTGWALALASPPAERPRLEWLPRLEQGRPT